VYICCIRNILCWSSKAHRVLLISESEDFKTEGEIGMLVRERFLAARFPWLSADNATEECVMCTDAGN